ncbi:hypothetical protein KCTC52924_00672 [Arenibacter antarcticus]
MIAIVPRMKISKNEVDQKKISFVKYGEVGVVVTVA